MINFDSMEDITKVAIELLWMVNRSSEAPELNGNIYKKPRLGPFKDHGITPFKDTLRKLRN